MTLTRLADGRFEHRRQMLPLDPQGFRYSCQPIYIPLSAHKTLRENANPHMFLSIPCSGKPDITVKPWSGEWQHGHPVGVDLLTTAHSGDFGERQPSQARAPIVNTCTCQQLPCLGRLPLRLSDPESIVIFDWQCVLDAVDRDGWDTLFLPTVFAITYLSGRDPDLS